MLPGRHLGHAVVEAQLLRVAAPLDVTVPDVIFLREAAVPDVDGVFLHGRGVHLGGRVPHVALVAGVQGDGDALGVDSVRGRTGGGRRLLHRLLVSH